MEMLWNVMREDVRVGWLFERIRMALDAKCLVLDTWNGFGEVLD